LILILLEVWTKMQPTYISTLLRCLPSVVLFIALDSQRILRGGNYHLLCRDGRGKVRCVHVNNLGKTIRQKHFWLSPCCSRWGPSVAAASSQLGTLIWSLHFNSTLGRGVPKG
jgi:hypothetical protein